MSNDLNSLNIIGRLTRNSNLTYSSSGVAICKFSIAVNRRVKKNGGYEDEASFFDCTMFSKSAEGLNKYLTKGQQISITGELQQQRWEKDGQNQSRVVIIVNSVQLLSSLGEKREGTQRPPQQTSAPIPTQRPQEPVQSGFGPDQFDDSEIPF